MKPVSYQNMPSSVHGGHPNMNHVLGNSKVMYCEKCGFASTDATVFNKHLMEHARTPFQCFYCNKIFFSEAELNTHTKQHTSKYSFVCPRCGQGYMRRLCLLKHMDRLHGNEEPPKPVMAKAPQVPACSALTSTSTADPAPFRPYVRVSPPTPTVPTVRHGKDEQRGKTMDTNLSHVTNGIAERSSFNGHTQHNRALTVPLPEEVSIPAGCMVELVEVKTVNGTKELKLRLFSQQENESVIKDSRTMVPQNLALGKPLSSTVNHPNTVRSNSMGTCIVNRKQCEQKAATVEHPVVVPASASNSLPNTVIKEKCGLKRPVQEIINLDSSPILNKIPKTILSPVREGNCGTRLPTAPVSPKATSSTVSPRGVISMLNTMLHPDSKVTGISPRVVEERKLGRPEHFNNIPPRRTSDPKNIRDVSLPVKLEPGMSHHKSNAVPKTIKECVSMTPQCLKSTSPSLSVAGITAAQIRPPAVPLSNDNVVNKPFTLSRTPNIPLSIKTNLISNYTTSENFSRSPDVRFNEMRKLESFPVISSVFSLSQQPEDDQGPIKPLVMALRGIVMDKNVGSYSASQNQTKMPNVTDQINKAPVTGRCAQVDVQNGSLTHDLLTQRINDSVKEEKPDKGIRQPPAPTPDNTCIKEEHTCSLTDDIKGGVYTGLKSSECTDSKRNKSTDLKSECADSKSIESTELKNEYTDSKSECTESKSNESTDPKSNKSTDSKSNESADSKSECLDSKSSESTNSKSSASIDSKLNTDEESQMSSCAEASPNPDPPQQAFKTAQNISSKYLTVSLKRVQVGVWKKCKKGLKLRISRYKTRVPVGDNCIVIHPMPLKLDQLVKQPGPYQPVVVLNHPKPQISPQGLRTNSFSDNEGFEVAPECHILKMRLSKVGRKYEVISFTVRLFP